MADPKFDVEHFRSIEWCSRVLDDLDFMITPSPSRLHKTSTEDALFAETLKSNHTISAWLTLCRRPNSSGENIGRSDEARTLVHLGYGVNGFPHVCHGGIVSALLDEAMGMLLTINKKYLGAEDADFLTASLNITFLKPVKTPSIVVIVSRFKEVKGRKAYVESFIQDSRGIILARADGLWLQARGKL